MSSVTSLIYSISMKTATRKNLSPLIYLCHNDLNKHWGLFMLGKVYARFRLNYLKLAIHMCNLLQSAGLRRLSGR